MVSDSVRPTDRPAARSAAEQILSFFGSEDPTDRPSFTARGGSEAVFQAFQPILPDRPTLPRPTRRSPAGSDLPPDRPSQQPPRDARCTFNFEPPNSVLETRSIILDKQIESSCASQGLARLVPCPWELGWVSRKFDGISCVGLDSHDAKLSLALRSGSRGHGLTDGPGCGREPLPR